MDAQLRVDHARILTDAGRFDEAVLEADRALAQRKGFSQAVHARVVAQRRAGRTSEAYTWLMPRLGGSTVLDSWLIDALAEVASEASDKEPIIEALRSALDQRLERDDRLPLLFKLGDLLDRSGRHDEAFLVVEEANALKCVSFDHKLHTSQTRELIERWGSQNPEIKPNDRFSPVFIVGLPRSGSSLVEQILSCHPAIDAAGETTEVIRAAKSLGVTRKPFGYVFSLEEVAEQELVRAGERMIERIARIAGGRPDRHLTEKLPENIMQVGFLSSLFPRARFIHCVRDFRDACLSCYFNDFSGALPFAYNIETCAHYAADTYEYARFWKGRIPDRFHVVQYANLVRETDAQVRTMLDFLGLPFEESCLRHHESDRLVRTSSYEQASKPIYHGSVGRWRRYEHHLRPVSRILSERGVPAEA